MACCNLRLPHPAAIRRPPHPRRPPCSFAAVGVPPAVMGIGPAVAIPAAVRGRCSFALCWFGTPGTPRALIAFFALQGCAHCAQPWQLSCASHALAHAQPHRSRRCPVPSPLGRRWRWLACPWTTLTCLKSTRPLPRRCAGGALWPAASGLRPLARGPQEEWGPRPWGTGLGLAA